ncbi:MFS general substrate transporter [Rhizodiscina lignyota]|uniref:MFS general substrate transporter n=1 Tax=Rhizodiscina lignyota TaxID=1504668 RepID=A0A9P4M3W1_9PEZI|nr:MFS general substrate transporter [Rhizodiscina lignyota]
MASYPEQANRSTNAADSEAVGEKIGETATTEYADREKKEPDSQILRDRHGLPLVPQPSSDPMDPLNWSPWLKGTVLAQVSLLSFTALLSASLIAPTYVPLGEFLHEDLVTTAYVTSVFIACAGIGSLFWIPFSNIYGRRPIYLLSLLANTAFLVASGKSKSYGEIMAMRALNGFFAGIPLGLGSATVVDLFFSYERGRYMGIYTVMLITGGHLAPVIGGYVAKNLTWQWCFYIPSIITAAEFIIFAATVPETLFSRAPEALARPSKPWTENMLMIGPRAHPTRTLHIVDFFRPAQLLLYPEVFFPTLYYAIIFTYGSILFIISSANLFRQIYHYMPQQTGLLLGLPLTIGSLLGETSAGWVSDYISRTRAIARGGERVPEDRLLGMIPGAILTPLGIIIEGVCLQKRTHWAGTAMGIGIASVGYQIVTTAVYSYTAECHKPQASELGAIISFSRQLMGFTIGFYAIPLSARIGIQNAWITFAFISVGIYLLTVPLLFWGRKWRREIDWHKDL